MSTSRHSWNCPPDPAGATALGTASRAALLLPLLLAGCGGTESSKPNVLMIVMDTVRADHLGCYGGPRVTPNLDDLAAASTRYETCTASSPWTVPSHGSLFTGRDPHTHGAHSFDLERFEGVDNVFTLLESEVTLAEILATEGYATGGVVANAAYLKPAFGLNQGFEDWVISRMPAGDLNGRALEWIDSVDQGRPSPPSPALGFRLAAGARQRPLQILVIFGRLLPRALFPNRIHDLARHETRTNTDGRAN